MPRSGCSALYGVNKKKKKNLNYLKLEINWITNFIQTLVYRALHTTSKNWVFYDGILELILPPHCLVLKIFILYLITMLNKDLNQHNSTNIQTWYIPKKCIRDLVKGLPLSMSFSIYKTLIIFCNYTLLCVYLLHVYSCCQI